MYLDPSLDGGGDALARLVPPEAGLDLGRRRLLLPAQPLQTVHSRLQSENVRHCLHFSFCFIIITQVVPSTSVDLKLPFRESQCRDSGIKFAI